jgi:hypothetical protein
MSTNTTNLPDVINIFTETADCPPLNTYGLSDLIRSADQEQAFNTFFAADGATCAIAGALTALCKIKDL